MSDTLPILYSFRRCPYAMRARIMLYKAGVTCELREVDLKNKPDHLLEISPKGTVPVLLFPDGKILEESLDIMSFAAEAAGFDAATEEVTALVTENDKDFIPALVKYKYAARYPEEDMETHRNICLNFIQDLNTRLEKNTCLLGSKMTLADVALFPFQRQCRIADPDWYDTQDLPHLHRWLHAFVEADFFKNVMQKNDPWKEGQGTVVFNP